MADSTRPDPGSRNTRRRAMIAFAAIGVSGMLSGAAANVGVAQLLALPEDAEPVEYTDAPVISDTTGPDDPGTPGEPGGHGPDRVRAPQALSKKTYGDAIVRRNIFDSTAVYNPQAAVANGNGECKSDSSMKLVATVVAEPMQFSSALISSGTGKDAGAQGYSIGDDLSGEGRITMIDQKRVCLDGGTCLCMGTEGVGKTVAASDSAEPSEGGVTKTGDNSYQVDQSLINDAMTDVTKLAGQLRVVPHKDSAGAVDGYRLSAIRRGSLFDKLGIKNGDVVHSVNGTPLTSTDGALATYQTLKNERSFTFEISRRNQRQTMSYEVR